MKIWIKYLTGMFLGTVIALIFSNNYQPALKILSPAAEVFINIGRYCFYPLIFFSLTIAVHELLNNRHFLSIHWKSISALVISTFALTAVGIISTLLFSPDRIPILLEKKETLKLLTLKEHLMETFPANLFSVFNSGGDFILPVVFLAFLIGLNLNYDKSATKPVIQLFDSLNRIFYHINSFILEIMALGIIVFSAIMVFRISSIEHIALYKQLFIILLIDSVFLIALVFSNLLALCLIDLRFKAVPDKLSLPTLLLAFASFPYMDSFQNALILAGGFALLRITVSFFTQKEAMGEADIIIASIIGSFLGLKLGALAIYIAAVIALLVFVVLRKKDYELPFIPFLSAGLVLVYVFDGYFSSLLEQLYG